MIAIPQRVRDIELPQFDLYKNLAAEWQGKGADVINLGQGLPGFEPPAVAVDALRRALEDASSHVYSADAGVFELRGALAASMASVGGAVDPDEIIITAGGNQAFQLALTTLVDPGEEVVLASPFFMNHEMTVRSVGAVPIEAPARAARAFAPTWDDMASHITPKTSAVVLVSPSNPTGAIVTDVELQHMANECAQRNIVLIVDETYLRFVYDSPPVTATALANWRDSVVIVGSFSKAFAITGWRCGYLMADPRVIAEALKIQDCMVICAPVPVQRAVTVVLEHEPDYATRWLPELRLRRETLTRRLGAIHGVTPVRPAGGFFVMARIEGMTDSRSFALSLIERQQVLTIPGVFFGHAGEGYLRISYGAATLERLTEACQRIGTFLRVS